jgi:lipopolysaccharide/colanic/teichoic acid biosynthesis glycosyltransferase
MGAKRLFDITFSALGLLILSPILFIISVCILLESGRPVIFKQERLGKNCEPFILYKFRTMESRVDSKQPDCTADNDKRVTKAGRFLRRYKLDEIPQLFNVLKGDMSFVGPRPELPKFASHYSKIYNKILQIKPGITDIAAIKYRNEHVLLNGAYSDDLEHIYLNEILPKKLEYSMDYLKKRSFFYDLKLIFQTISIVIFK